MLRRKYFLMEEAGDGKGAGGNGDAAAGSGGKDSGASGGLFDDSGAGKEGAGKGAAGANGGAGAGGDGGDKGKGAGGVSIPENWKDALPEDLRKMPALEKLKDIPSLVKSYANLEKMLGSEKVPVPAKGATLEQMKDYFQKAGLPSEETEYKVDTQVKNVDADFLKAFSSEAFKLNVLPAQAKGIVEWFAKTNGEIHQKQMDAYTASVNKGLNDLKVEWGEAHAENMAKAKAAIREFTTPEQQEMIKKMGLGTDVTFIKMMSKIGGTLGEDKVRGEGGTGKNIMTPSEAQIKIAEIKANTKGAYYDKTHAEHEATKREVAALYNMAYPGPKIEDRKNA